MTHYEENQKRLLQEAVDAHNAYVEGTNELKFQRQLAFKRAINGKVTRQEIGAAIGKAVRTVSHIINGK